jgi:hypothetical protein
MMLRASVDQGVTSPSSSLLAELVAGVTSDDPARADAARTAVCSALGADWLVDACAVIANFEMMTRLADGTGARLRPPQLAAAAPIIEQHGLRGFPSART